MDPLQLLVHRQSLDWATSNSLVLIVASCLVPLVYNLVSTQASQLFARITRHLRDQINQYEFVLVYHNEGRNNLYRYISVFLNSKAEAAAVSKNASIQSPMEEVVIFGVEPGEVVADKFGSMSVEWEYCLAEKEQGGDNYFKLRIRKQDRHLQAQYLLHIANTVTEMEQKKMERSLYACREPRNNPYWECNVFKHPASFETLAMDSELKSRIMNDLREFTMNREYYESVGKPWKRGYLLYGPPGTGKSSLIAAIANYLSYDVYDLDLAGIRSNADLRNLLITTTSRSVIVIEDIDCCFSSDLHARESAVETSKKKKKKKRYDDSSDGDGITLSGMLNFCDGLWSGSGSERVFIFTTNHVENLDPALLRKGRMDLHICMSYCQMEAFKMLVKRYLKIEEHELFGEIEELIEEAQVTPADVAEVLLSSRRDPVAALENTIELLRQKIDERSGSQEQEETQEEHL